MKKFLGLLVLCLFLASCTCNHNVDNKERVFETEICTCIEIKTYADNSAIYSFIGEKVPVRLSADIYQHRKIITPQIGGRYKIRYSWWKCANCQKYGKYHIQDVIILEEYKCLERKELIKYLKIQ